MSRRAGLACALALVVGAPAAGQGVTGGLFEDRNANGEWDAGERALGGVSVGLFGALSDGTPVDLPGLSDGGGRFSFPTAAGCYLIDVADPPGWRRGPATERRVTAATPGHLFPVGLSRWGKLDRGVGHLRGGALLYAAAGDSIAWNFNVCAYPQSFWYSNQVRSRLACAAPFADVALVKVAVKGEHTDDLLVDDHDDQNNVFRLLELHPDLITLSMIGNDLLDVDTTGALTPEQTERMVDEVLDARQNLQEALSALVSELPDADVALNTLYDNLAYDCEGRATSELHRIWLPIVNRILRDLAWGQTRRVSVVEAAAEFGQESVAGSCTGFSGLICRDLFGFDDIHPDNDGYAVLREKSWEALGGVGLGANDVLGRDAVELELGFLRHVGRLYPSLAEVKDGAVVTDPAAALREDDAGASAEIALGAGGEAFELAGFPDWFDEHQIVRAVVGVRYRTRGTVADDFYRIEAAPTGQFRPPPGFLYTPTDWNFYTPIVGGGGPSRPASNPDYPDARVLALPEVPAYREVSATLTKNPELPVGADDYVWPAIDHSDLATTRVRVVSAPVAATPGNDAYSVELDAAWIDLYGWERRRPAELRRLTLDRADDGAIELIFDDPLSAQRYNVYWGTLPALSAGSYDHGAGAICDAPAAPGAPGRLDIAVPPGQVPGGSAYVLITHHVNDVESPAGSDSGNLEIDRSQSVCR